MFAEIEISGPVVDPECWDGIILVVTLLGFGLGAYFFGPALLWRWLRPELPSPPPAPQPEVAAPHRRPHESQGPGKRSASGVRAPVPSHNPADKRDHVRRKGEARPVLLSDSPAHAAPALGWVADRSQRGLGIVTDRPFATGAVLAVRPEDAPDDVPWVQLEVRNCRPQGKLWHVGGQFTRQLPWGVVLLFG